MIADQVYESIIDILKEADKDTSEIKLKKNLNDYTIQFFQNAAVKVKTGKQNYLYIKSEFMDNVSPDFEFKESKSTPNYLRCVYELNSDFKKLSDVIKDIYEKTSSISEKFGCCSLYISCSDELKCINTDIQLTKGCLYKKNIERGNIFYGKNKNM